MKKHLKFVFGVCLAIGLLIAFTGCDMDVGEQTSTFYVRTFIFSSSHSIWGTLQNNQFLRLAISNADFEWEKQNNFQGAPQYEWTEDQLYSYLIGWGFGSSQAREAASWFFSVNHGQLGLRVGSNLSIILK